MHLNDKERFSIIGIPRIMLCCKRSSQTLDGRTDTGVRQFYIYIDNKVKRPQKTPGNNDFKQNISVPNTFYPTFPIICHLIFKTSYREIVSVS